MTHDPEERALLEEHLARMAALPPLTSRTTGPLSNDALRRLVANNHAHAEGMARSCRAYAKAVLELHARRRATP